MTSTPSRPHGPPTAYSFRVLGGLSLGAAVTGCSLIAGLPDWRLATFPDDARAQDGSSAADGFGGDGQGGGDAGPDGAPPEDAGPGCHTNDPFGPVSAVTELNTVFNDGFARFSQDENLVVFESNRIGGSSKIFSATRANRQSPFVGITQLAESDMGGLEEFAPSITGDALTVYYHATNGTIIPQVFYVTRPSLSSGFGSPSSIPGLPPPSYHPFVHPSGQYLLTVSGPPDGGAPYLLMQANLSAPGSISNVMPVNFPNPPSGAFLAPLVSPDGREFFGSASGQIWHATRASGSGPFSTPELLLELSDAVQSTYPDWISPDRCRLYFHRTTPSSGTEIFVAARPFH